MVLHLVMPYMVQSMRSRDHSVLAVPNVMVVVDRRATVGLGLGFQHVQMVNFVCSFMQCMLQLCDHCIREGFP